MILSAPFRRGITVPPAADGHVPICSTCPVPTFTASQWTDSQKRLNDILWYSLTPGSTRALRRRPSSRQRLR
ncbi:hypothetical protein E2C01_031141 [Portunus trituberculatus]|uniref:Uncharacterized protein n=1 Tax=Portunus trituberculatus TaxID=210409 RepID=A0A5B7EZA5_PORTR|nr:hypothetical protein [Portunus trituberculatus]